MTKYELVKEFKERAGLNSQKDAKEIMEALGEVIISHMKDKDGVTPWTGVKFYAVHKDAHVGRNPATNETIEIEAKYQPKVRFGSTVRSAIND